MASWTLVIPDWVPPTVNRLLRSHWAKRRKIKDGASQLIWWATREADVPPATSKRRICLVVEVTNRSHAPDPDNLWKVVLDGLKRCGMIVDDRAEWCAMGTVVIRKGEKRRTEITIEELA